MSAKAKAIGLTVLGIALGVSIGLLRHSVNIYVAYLLFLLIFLYAFVAGYYTALRSKSPKRPK
jgi:membrane protein DedA with SNARE-associated domain